jgi:hypothetical protein
MSERTCPNKRRVGGVTVSGLVELTIPGVFLFKVRQDAELSAQIRMEDTWEM